MTDDSGSAGRGGSGPRDRKGQRSGGYGGQGSGQGGRSRTGFGGGGSGDRGGFRGRPSGQGGRFRDDQRSDRRDDRSGGRWDERSDRGGERRAPRDGQGGRWSDRRDDRSGDRRDERSDRGGERRGPRDGQGGRWSDRRDDRSGPRGGQDRWSDRRDDRSGGRWDERSDRGGERRGPRDGQGGRWSDRRDDRPGPRDGQDRRGGRPDRRDGGDRRDDRSGGRGGERRWQGRGDRPYRSDDRRGARPDRPGRPQRDRDEPRDPRDVAPPLPEEVQAHQLDGEVRAELSTLPKSLADAVSRHLVMAGEVMDEDPDLAYRHAVYARRKASRVGAVREASGVAAYKVGKWQEALSDLRAARRMTGNNAYLAIMADCERGLGRPERALELARGPEARELGGADRVELRIVASGARRDLGELSAALVELQGPELKERRARPWVARLFYAYADVLDALERSDEAREYFAKASAVDREGATDADERLAELEGVEIVDVGGDVVWSDAEDPAVEDDEDGEGDSRGASGPGFAGGRDAEPAEGGAEDPADEDGEGDARETSGPGSAQERTLESADAPVDEDGDEGGAAEEAAPESVRDQGAAPADTEEGGRPAPED